MRFIRPCAPTLRRAPPVGPEWVHEVKWDGWRLQAHKDGATVRVFSRPGNDLSDRFSAIAKAVAGLPRRSVILDAELVAFGDDGRPDFRLLRRKRAAVVAFVFDILENDGAELRSKPWKDRRVFLERLMGRNRDPILQLNQVWDDGAALLRAVGEQGLEGIVSKYRPAPYCSGHTDAWIKVKVPGWTEAKRRRFK
jgi:bifunctional non-homologous end joining protein LigD